MLRINRHHFHLAKKQLGDHLRVAFPMAFQMSIIAIGALNLQFALNGLGAVSVAAYTAAQKIDSIATMPVKFSRTGDDDLHRTELRCRSV